MDGGCILFVDTTRVIGKMSLRLARYSALFYPRTKVILLLALASPMGLAQQAKAGPLQLSVQQASPCSTFEASLHNAGKHFLILDPGLFSGANNLRIPVGVKLSFTNSEGHTIHAEGRVPGVLGTMGWSGLYLPAGGTFLFQLDLQDFAPVVKTGHYILRATYFSLPYRTAGRTFTHDPSSGKVRVRGIDGNPVEVDPSTPVWSGSVTSVLVQLTSPFVLKQIPLDIAQRRIMGTPMVVVIWSFFLVTSFLLSAFTLLLVRKDSGPATKPIRWGSILLMAFWTLVFASILTGD